MSLKIAVVGVGKVARQNYLPCLAAQADVELGLYNRTEEKAREAARERGGTVLTTLQDVADWNPDAALVLTSETCRYEVASELIHRGVRRLFFEKPLVAAAGQAHVTEEDFRKGKALLAQARERGVETAMVFNYRFFEHTLAAKRAVAERGLGQAINAMGMVHYACWSHCIDLVHHFAGGAAEISALSGPVERKGQGIAAHDLAVTLRMENGAVATLIATAGMKWQHPLYELTVTFENGRLHLRDLDGDLEILDGARPTQETVRLGRDTSRWNQYTDSFRKSVEAYLDSLRQGVPPPVPGIDGLRELQVEAAIRRSIAERRPVVLAEEFPV